MRYRITETRQFLINARSREEAEVLFVECVDGPDEAGAGIQFCEVSERIIDEDES